jgi:hypothetical protein
VPKARGVASDDRERHRNAQLRRAHDRLARAPTAIQTGSGS